MDMDKLEKEAEEALYTIATYCDSICDCNNCIFTGKGKVSNCVLREAEFPCDVIIPEKYLLSCRPPGLQAEFLCDVIIPEPKCEE